MPSGAGTAKKQSLEGIRLSQSRLAHRVDQLGEFPGLQGYLARLMERPAAKKAFGG